VAPAGVPADRLKLLETAFLEAVNDPKLTQRIEALGMIRRPSNAAAYQALMATELERYGRIVKAAGIQPQ
jgi:tripartite-type tricarboxylate transporter receptor subunit TctC